MTKKILNINWSELFFPIYNDIKNINEEASTTVISNNNWDLVNENSEHDYKEVISKIKENRNDEKSNHDIIVL